MLFIVQCRVFLKKTRLSICFSLNRNNIKNVHALEAGRFLFLKPFMQGDKPYQLHSQFDMTEDGGNQPKVGAHNAKPFFESGNDIFFCEAAI